LQEDRIWKEAGINLLKVFSMHSPDETEENHDFIVVLEASDCGLVVS